MKQIELTQGKFATVDDQDFDWLNQWSWYYQNRGYAACKESDKTIFMHRMILDAPDGMQVDHINGLTLDNRRENLRVCSHSENQRNSRIRSDNTSGFKGVRWHQGKWQARIKINGTSKSLGHFSNRFDAAFAYDRAARELFQDFANTNFKQSDGILTFQAAGFDSLLRLSMQ